MVVFVRLREKNPQNMQEVASLRGDFGALGALLITYFLQGADHS